MESTRPAPRADDRLGPGFERALRWSLVLVVIVSVIGFAVSSGHLLWSQSHREARQHAQLCAAALIPTTQADFEASAKRLLGASERVAAVGKLDPTGKLEWLFPNLAPYQGAAAAALSQSPDLAIIKLDEAGIRGTYWSTVVDASEDFAAQSRRFLVIAAHDSYGMTWIRAILMYSLCAGATAVVAGKGMARWFNRTVTRPLGALSELIQNCTGRCAFQQTSAASKRPLSHGMAGEFAEIAQRWAQVEARVLKTEKQAERKWRDHESGLSRRLRRAEDRATRDALTRLRNRSFLEQELEDLVEQHRSSGRELAFVMMDLDNFKKHNDTFGHKAGDELLRFVGDLLKGSIRFEDHAVRYGGDEFLLLLSGVKKEQAVCIAQRIVQMFKQYVSSIVTAAPLSLSAGVAVLSEYSGVDGHGLIGKADTALYASKRAGKNSVAAA